MKKKTKEPISEDGHNSSCPHDRDWVLVADRLDPTFPVGVVRCRVCKHTFKIWTYLHDIKEKDEYKTQNDEYKTKTIEG